MTGSVALAALAAAWAAGGLLLGAAYFTALRWTVDLFAAGPGRLMPAMLTLGRLAAAALFLVVAARSGALPLLSAFLGFLVARTVALRWARRVA